MKTTNTAKSIYFLERKSTGALEERVLQTLHLADRRGYGLTLTQLLYGIQDIDMIYVHDYRHKLAGLL